MSDDRHSRSRSSSRSPNHIGDKNEDKNNAPSPINNGDSVKPNDGGGVDRWRQWWGGLGNLDSINKCKQCNMFLVLFGIILFACLSLTNTFQIGGINITKGITFQIGGINITTEMWEEATTTDSNATHQTECSSYRTYGKLGGREVMMHDSHAHPGWKGSSQITPEACAKQGDCYPDKVLVKGVDVLVETGVNSFTITSLFARDEFHVALEGPELSPTFVKAHGNGTYTVSYCVELPGFYKLYVRILQINGTDTLRKDIFQSPFSVRVRGKAEAELQTLPTESNQVALDFCTSARQATQGRWVRFDHAKRYNLVPSFELQQWGEVLEVTRDEYVWIPYSCRLRPMTLDDLRALYQNRSHCLCCDSYIRTLFSDTMSVLGIFNKTQHEQTRDGSLIHRNWDIHGMAMAWHDMAYFERCLQKHPNGLSVENILGGKPNPGHVAHHSATVGKTSGKFVFTVGHPWSGDHRVARRSNYMMQDAQRASFIELDSDIDIFDAFAFTFPRIYHEACDSSHVSCVISDRLTMLGFWEMLIFAQML